MDFHVRLRQLRHKHKLTQGELAAILGLKPTAVSNYESKRNEPSLEKLDPESIQELKRYTYYLLYKQEQTPHTT